MPTVVALAAVFALGLAGCSTSATGTTGADDANAAPASSAATTSDAGTGHCEGGEAITIDRSADTRITGDCGSVTITASNLFVQLDGADSVTVSGSHVDIAALEKLGTLTIEGSNGSANLTEVGTLALIGDHVQLTAVQVDRASISGDQNTVGWTRGTSDVDDSGFNNSIVATAG